MPRFDCSSRTANLYRRWLAWSLCRLLLAPLPALAAPSPAVEYDLTPFGIKALLQAMDEQARYVAEDARLAPCARYVFVKDVRAELLKVYFRTTLTAEDGHWHVARTAVTDASVVLSKKEAACLFLLSVVAYSWYSETHAEDADAATMIGLYEAIVGLKRVVDVDLNGELAKMAAFLRKLARKAHPSIGYHFTFYLVRLHERGLVSREFLLRSGGAAEPAEIRSARPSW